MWFLLGMKSFIGGISTFFSKNWQWLLPLLGAVFLYFYVGHLISSARADGYKQGYSKGVLVENTRWKKDIASEDKRNRDFEQRLVNVIVKYGSNLVVAAVKRLHEEQVFQNKIETIVHNRTIYQSCKIDQDALDAKNNIRRLGPKPSVTVALPPAPDAVTYKGS